MYTRPFASVKKPPALANGGFGAACAAVVVITNTARRTVAARRSIVGRLPHLAARNVHLGRSLAGLRARSGPPGRTARLPLRLHDAPRRARLPDTACGLRTGVGDDQAWHRGDADLLADAGRDRAAGGDDRRDRAWPPDAGHRRLTSGDRREL